MRWSDGRNGQIRYKELRGPQSCYSHCPPSFTSGTITWKIHTYSTFFLLLPKTMELFVLTFCGDIVVPVISRHSRADPVCSCVWEMSMQTEAKNIWPCGIHTQNSLLWAELCPSQIHVLKFLLPGPHCGTSFGNKTLREVIKIKWGYRCRS
jgi:hypothetical protein